MAFLQLRLANGKRRHLQVANEKEALEALQQGRTPFSASWLKTDENTWVAVANIVEVEPVEHVVRDED